jgi:peroxiredoxin
LRQDYAQFEQRGIQIIALGPDGPNAFRRYWQENDMPFIGCADIKSRAAEHFHQEVNLFKFGRMPAIFIIDPQGVIRYSHYGDSMSDIPDNVELFTVIDQFEPNAEPTQPD